MQRKDQQAQGLQHGREERHVAAADRDAALREQVGHDGKDVGEGQALKQWFDGEIAQGQLLRRRALNGQGVFGHAEQDFGAAPGRQGHVEDEGTDVALDGQEGREGRVGRVERVGREVLVVGQQPRSLALHAQRLF